jgi:hypothetical protein
VIIPLCTAIARLIEILGISEASIGRLKKELVEQQKKMQEKIEEVVDPPCSRSSMCWRASTMSIPIFSSNRKPRFGAI